MTIMTRPGAILKIKILQNSSAANYFETQERLTLQNTLIELESKTENPSEDQINKIQKIFQKYEKYL